MSRPVEEPQRSRSKTMLSFSSSKSHKSRRSNGSISRKDLKETHEEKSKNKLKSKADPTLAMSEEEPSSIATGQGSNMESLRARQHRDMHGNIIADPDLSNPTRSRWERPLDTIRSFEAAIDGRPSRRPMTKHGESFDGTNSYSRRSSYHQNYTMGSVRPTREMGGYYGHRMSQSGPEGYGEGYSGQSPYNRARHGPRMPLNHSPNGYHTPHGVTNGQHVNHGVYPSQGYQRSYDTVTTASGSAGYVTDPWGNSTDPSSENSSIDRIQQAPKPDPAETYGFTGFGSGPDLHSLAPGDSPINGAHEQPQINGAYQDRGRSDFPPQAPPHGPQYAAGPSPPPKGESFGARTPIKLGSSSPPSTQAPDMAGAAGEPAKRKSWFKRLGKS